MKEFSVDGRRYTSPDQITARLSALNQQYASRDFPNDAREEWNQLNDVLSQLGEQESRDLRLRELHNSSRQTEHVSESLGRTAGVRSPAQGRDVGLRMVDSYVRSGDLRSDAADRLDDVLKRDDPTSHTARYLAAVGNPAYKTAFGKMVTDPNMGHLRFSSKEVEAFRVVSAVESERAIGDSTTGVPLPFTLDPSIILTGTGVLNPIRDISRVITVGTLQWKGVSSDGVTASYVPEATESTDASPTLVQPTITTAQGRAFVPFSIEVSQDWPEIENELARLIVDARNVLDGTKFLSGSGTNEPKGILTTLTTTQRVQTAGTAAYSVGDPWLLKAAIPARFIANTTFAANPATWDKTYRFVAQGSTTEPRQFSDGDRGGDFLGRPKVEYSAMATALTTGTKLVIAGDFQTAYTIVDRLGMTAELIPHLFGAANHYPTGQRGLYCYWRTGADVVAVNALRYLETL